MFVISGIEIIVSMQGSLKRGLAAVESQNTFTSVMYSHTYLIYPALHVLSVTHIYLTLWCESPSLNCMYTILPDLSNNCMFIWQLGGQMLSDKPSYPLMKEKGLGSLCPRPFSFIKFLANNCNGYLHVTYQF